MRLNINHPFFLSVFLIQLNEMNLADLGYSNEFDAEVTGNLRFSAKSSSDFPAVGDWVAISEYEKNKVLIHAVFQRSTIIERQAVGENINENGINKFKFK